MAEETGGTTALATSDQLSSGWFDGRWAVTQPFGVWESVAGLNGPHTGVDVGLPTGTTLRTPVHAQVLWAGDQQNGYGRYTKLQLDDGTQVIMGHMSDIAVHVGDSLQPGSVVGHSGSTGASTGPHLHFEVRQGGRAVDPSSWLSTAGPVAGSVGAGTVAKSGNETAQDFFHHLVQQDHDACHPPADEGTILRVLDLARCPANWWRVLFIMIGLGMITTGVFMYITNRAAPYVVQAGKLAAEAA